MRKYIASISFSFFLLYNLYIYLYIIRVCVCVLLCQCVCAYLAPKYIKVGFFTLNLLDRCRPAYRFRISLFFRVCFIFIIKTLARDPMDVYKTLLVRYRQVKYRRYFSSVTGHELPYCCYCSCRENRSII